MQVEPRPKRLARASLLWTGGALLWLLLTSSAHAAAPAGQWWNLAYNYRVLVTVPAGTTALPTDYPVSVVFNHSAQVALTRSLTNANDVRVVRWTGSGWTELDRVIDPDTLPNTTGMRLWFATTQSIAANGSDNNYYLYFNNPAATAPTNLPENIFLLYDDFGSGTVASSRWGTSGTVSVSGGVVQLNPGASLMATSAYSFSYDTIWETRARLSDTYGALDYWGATSVAFFGFTSYLRFQADSNSHQAVANDIDGLDPTVKPFVPVTPTSYQNYSFTREGSTLARFLINSTQVATFNGSEVPSSSLRAGADNNDASDRLFYDWARVRAYRNPDPTLTQGLPEPRNAGADHFVMVHDRSGINCLVETIVVNARDVSNNPVTTYTEQITLNTGSGKGTWSKVTGGGAFADGTANDGIATYQWVTGEGSATFTLYYPEGTPTLDIEAYQSNNTLIRDDDSELSFTFAPSGFTVTSAALSNPPPATIPTFPSPQTAGTGFNFYLAAYGQTPTDPVCGVIETYTGAKTLEFRSTYVNPVTASVRATINDTTLLPLDGSYASRSVTFTNGLTTAALTAKYKDVGSFAISIRDGAITGSTGNLVVKPSTFAINVSGVPALVPVDGSGAKFVAAGAPFSVTVTARDAEGATTPNYGKESPAQSIELLPTLVAPSGGQNPAVTSVGGTPTFNAGVSTWNFAWPEVGIITLIPHVSGGKYLNTVDVAGPTTGNIGRFVPSTFGLAPNIPAFQTGCTPTSPYSGFTYIGQPLNYTVAPSVTATALAAGGTTTRNYMGPFRKLSPATVTRTYSAIGGGFTLNTAAPPNAVVTATSNGVNEVLLDATSGVSIARSAALAPFNATIGLAVNLIDTDLVTSLTPASFGNSLTGIAFSGNTPQQRYGRLAFRNAVGSELLPLGVPLRTEYFMSDAAGFVRNRDDMCTSTVTVSLTAPGGNLSTGDTCVLDNGQPGKSTAGCSALAASSQQFQSPPTALAGASPPDGGDFNLWLRAPGNNNDGTLTITGNAPAWLQFDWNAAASGLENPSGIATFGIYQGSSRRIYQRERVR